MYLKHVNMLQTAIFPEVDWSVCDVCLPVSNYHMARLGVLLLNSRPLTGCGLVEVEQCCYITVSNQRQRLGVSDLVWDFNVEIFILIKFTCLYHFAYFYFICKGLVIFTCISSDVIHLGEDLRNPLYQWQYN